MTTSTTARKFESPRTGSCLCGDVLYEIDEVLDTGYCHCRNCQTLTGTAVRPWASVSRTGFRQISGAPSRYEHSPLGEQLFCPRCGSQLWWEPYNVDEPVLVSVGSLNNPDGLAPRIHQWYGSRIEWFETTDSCLRVDDGTLGHSEKRER